MNHPSVGRIVPPAAGFLSLQFGCLWCACYVTLVLLAVVEGVFLRHMGVEYIPKSSLRHVSVRDFCVSADGRWAAARMSFRCGSAGAGITDDVVVFDRQRQTTRRLYLSQLEPRCLAISPTGESLAIACADRSIYVLEWSRDSATSSEPLNGEKHFLHRARGLGITRLVFSPDGQQLAAVGTRHIHLLRIPAEGIGGPAALLHRWPCGGKAISVAFSDDSRSLVVFGLDGELRWYDSQGGQLVGGKY